MHAHTQSVEVYKENENEFPFPLKRGERRNSPKREPRFDIYSPVSVNSMMCSVQVMWGICFWRVCALMTKGLPCLVETSDYSSESFGPVGGPCEQLWLHASPLGGCSVLAAVVLLFIWTSRPSPLFARLVEKPQLWFYWVVSVWKWTAASLSY